MSSGSILKNIALFSVPLVLSSILQLLYNATDIIIVGKFDGDNALAAVGSTSSVINLLINVFMGYATGSGVIISRYFGGSNEAGTRRAVSTCISMSMIFGAVLMAVGICAAKPLMRLMACPEDVLDAASLYMRIYFAGMPAFMLYNFGSGILRAVGDTKRPLRYLTFSGIINVLLNLFFVIKLHMGVAGVAAATVTAQFISAGCVIRCLVRTEECYRLDIKNLRLHKKEFVMMTKIGLPAGIQGSLFSFSNVIVQSSVNTFGSTVMAGNAAGANVESFVYAMLNSISQAALTFTGQNFGAGKFKRIKRGLWTCLGIEFFVIFSVSILVRLSAHQILRIYSDDIEVINVGARRLSVICFTYFLCGFNEVLVAVLRGLGSSVLPMVTSIFGICGLRILFIMTVFKHIGSLESLYFTYPLSWGITAAIHGILIAVLWKKLISHRTL